MILAFLLLLVLVNKNKDIVEDYIHSIILWVLICFGLTEVLSAFDGITFRNLVIAWGIVDVLLALIIIACKKKVNMKLVGVRKSYLTLFVAYSIIMVFLAIKMVPYNWDSMTYHLSRLYHWMQNKSVAHYATNNDRQVASPVLGAFINLHVYVMHNGDDHFINLLQCMSYLTNGILVYSIARKLKCKKTGCFMASILFYTTPIAFAEALTTQVDNFSALWLLSYVYLILDFMDISDKLRFEKDQMINVMSLGLCIAFGYLAKPSVGFGMLLFAMWLLVICIIRKDSIATIIKMIACVAPIIVAVLLPETLRNIKTFNSVSNSNVGQRQLIGTLKPAYVLINLLKNLTFNFPNAYFSQLGDNVKNAVISFSGLLKVDINDPSISEDGGTFVMNSARTYQCDTAVNPVVVISLLLSIICFILIVRRIRLSEKRNGYFIVSVLSFFVFCAMLRWERFVSRYMISYLALLCPAIVIAIEEFSQHRKKEFVIAAYSIIGFLCLSELYGLFLYHGNKAVESSRYSGYFADNSGITDSYIEMAEYINKCGVDKVGLWIGGDSYEYPLDKMLDEEIQIEHVNVTNKTSVYIRNDFIPDVIFATDVSVVEELEYNNTTYILAKGNDYTALYVREN